MGKAKYPLCRRPAVKAFVCFAVALGGVGLLVALVLPARHVGGPEKDDDDVAKPYVAVKARDLGVVHEKRGPEPGATRDWKVGKSWGGQWRASSEPGELYMAGEALEAKRLAAFGGGGARAAAAGFYATPSGDSVAVEALVGNCSRYGVKPPPHYPAHYPITDVIANWPPDSVAVPPRHFASLCRFDYADPVAVKQATAFRKLELPFVVQNNAEVDAVVKQWSTPGVLEKRLGTKHYRCERSDDNHFMYYGGHGNLRGWREPTENVQMKYADWLAYAPGRHEGRFNVAST